MSNRWIYSILIGVGLLVLGIWWTINPIPLFEHVCLQAGCGIRRIFGVGIAVFGITAIGAAFAIRTRDKERQTVTIAIEGEAEDDAEALGVIQDSVSHHESAERHFQGPPEAVDKHLFAELTNEEVNVMVEKKEKSNQVKKKKAHKK